MIPLILTVLVGSTWPLANEMVEGLCVFKIGWDADHLL